MMSPEFLDGDDVIEIHRRQIQVFGGHDSIRDAAFLDSALAQPMTAFGGHFLHSDLFTMAAAYLFRIARNHPFIDGNKRTALAAALTFLDLNEHPVPESGQTRYDATMAVAEGRLNKGEIRDLLQSLAQKSPDRSALQPSGTLPTTNNRSGTVWSTRPPPQRESPCIFTSGQRQLSVEAAFAVRDLDSRGGQAMSMGKWIGAGSIVLAMALPSPADDRVPYDTPNDEPSRVEKGIFAEPVRLQAEGKVIDSGPSWGHCGPWVEDVDGDGVRDLIVGDFSGLFHLYHNQGTDRSPRYAAGVQLQAGGTDAKVPIY